MTMEVLRAFRVGVKKLALSKDAVRDQINELLCKECRLSTPTIARLLSRREDIGVSGETLIAIQKWMDQNKQSLKRELDKTKKKKQP